MDRLRELKEEEELDEKWRIFLKDLESKRAVKAKRKLDLPSSMVGNLSKKRRLYSSTTDMTEATMSPGIEGVKMILAIEYFPENEVLQKRRGVAIPTHSENQQTKTDYPAVCYEKLLAIDYVPVSEVPTLRQDQGTRDGRPEKIILKWKTKRKPGENSSMKVLDMKAYFKSLLVNKPNIPGVIGQENVSSPKRKFREVNQENIPSPNKKFKNIRDFWVGREGAAKSEDEFKMDQ